MQTKNTRTLSYIPPGATLAYEGDHYDVYTRTISNIDDTPSAAATRYEIVVRKPRVWLLMLADHDVITLTLEHYGSPQPLHGIPSSTTSLSLDEEYDTTKIITAAQTFGQEHIGIINGHYTRYDSYLRHNDIRTLDHLIVVQDTVLSSDRSDYYTRFEEQQRSFGDFVQEAYETDFAAPHGFLMELHAAARSRKSLNRLAEKMFMSE